MDLNINTIAYLQITEFNLYLRMQTIIFYTRYKTIHKTYIKYGTYLKSAKTRQH